MVGLSKQNRLCVFLAFYVFFIMLSCSQTTEYYESKKIEYSFPASIQWKSGIGLKGGKPIYLNHEKMAAPYIFMTKRCISKTVGDIVKAGKIVFGDDYLTVYPTPKNDPADHFKYHKKGKKLFVKYDSLGTLLSDNKKNWNRLNIKIVDDTEKQYGRAKPPVYIVVKLECKWFKGEYEVGGVPG